MARITMAIVAAMLVAAAAWAGEGTVTVEGPKTALAAITSFDTTVKADKIELSKLYTNDFARRAKERFKA